MSAAPVIVLIDGEHHPAAVRDVLALIERDRPVAATIFCGGEEKVSAAARAAPEAHYGRAVDGLDGEPPGEALRRLVEAASDGDRPAAVVDLADEPVLPPPAKLRLAALALHLGLAYESPGLTLPPPTYAPVDFAGPKLAVIGTGKRTGKTAVAGHWATLLRERGAMPVIVSMGRGGPAEPRIAPANTSLADLERIAAQGGHAASDYLEDAALAHVPAVGCRRVGGGLAGEPFHTTVLEGARVAAGLNPRALVFEGSGATVPPVAVDRTVCVVGAREDALGELGPYRLLRSDLTLVMHGDDRLARDVHAAGARRVLRCELRPEPAEELAEGTRVAVFSTGPAGAAAGLDVAFRSSNLSKRSALVADLDRAAAERCGTWLVELKAAAIDTVALRARSEGVRVVFLRNRPAGLDGDLDAALNELFEEAAGGA